MALQNVLVSQKINNYNYAPGIATYGIDGLSGNTGSDGNNIYFTNYDITSIDDLQGLSSQVISNYLPIKSSTVKLNRPYKNGDIFFDKYGVIYSLFNIDDFIVAGEEMGHYTNYFVISGKINVADSSGFFKESDGRLILNSSVYNGFDIVTGIDPQSAGEFINSSTAVNIISNIINENDNIEMVNMQSIDDIDVEDGKFSVFYKTTENAYYLQSNKPIIINGDVKLNNSIQETEYDNYSTVLTSDDTITYFKHICDNLTYSVNYDSTQSIYNLMIFSNSDSSADQLNDLEYIINRNETVFGKVYDNDNDQVLIKLENIDDTSVNPNYQDLPLEYSNLSYLKNENKGYLYIDNSFIAAKQLISDSIIDNKLNIEVTVDSTSTLVLDNAETFLIATGISVQQITTRTLYSAITNGGVVSLNPSSNLLPIKEQYYPTANNEYVFKINPQQSTIIRICFNILSGFYPASSIQDSSGLLRYMTPSYIDINVPDELRNDNCILVFSLDYSNVDSGKLNINNIMFFRESYLEMLNWDSISDRPYVKIPLPNNIDSVKKFSLLHNTEIFIKHD